jgi:hypothetical protein
MNYGKVFGWKLKDKSHKRMDLLLLNSFVELPAFEAPFSTLAASENE